MRKMSLSLLSARGEQTGALLFPVEGPGSAGQGPGSESLCAGPGNTADPCPCKPNQLRDLDRD